MIQKFESYEKAAMFVEEKHSEGFHAYIMNESTAFLWGPRTLGGFRVFVSDEPLPPGTPTEELEQESPPDDLLTKIIRTSVLILVGIGVVSGVVSGLASLGTTLSLILGLTLALGFAILGGYCIFRRDFPQRPED